MLLFMMAIGCDDAVEDGARRGRGGEDTGDPIVDQDGPTLRECTCWCDYEGPYYYYDLDPQSAEFCTEASNEEAAQLVVDEVVLALIDYGYYNIECTCECDDLGEPC